MLSDTNDFSPYRKPGTPPEMTIALLVKMAQEAERRKLFPQAEALLKRACKKAEDEYGAESASVATILWDLSVVYEQQGKLGQADEIADRVREILAARTFRRRS